MKPDRIERDITVAAPIERVWAVLTRPEHIAVWFGAGTPNPAPVDIDLRPGGVMVLDHGEYGRFPTRIEHVEPPTYFAYRWASAYPGELATDDNSTLVEFRLTATNDKTLVQVVETGFASLVIPADREETAGYESHSEGWTEVIKALAVHAEDS